MNPTLLEFFQAFFLHFTSDIGKFIRRIAISNPDTQAAK